MLDIIRSIIAASSVPIVGYMLKTEYDKYNKEKTERNAMLNKISDMESNQEINLMDVANIGSTLNQKDREYRFVNSGAMQSRISDLATRAIDTQAKKVREGTLTLAAATTEFRDFMKQRYDFPAKDL